MTAELTAARERAGAAGVWLQAQTSALPSSPARTATVVTRA